MLPHIEENRDVSALADTTIVNDYVFLLHGMARSSGSMEKIEEYLSEKGYSVFNEGYPSRKLSVEMIVDSIVVHQIRSLDLDEGQKISFVTHSLGGIVVRYLLQEYPDLPVNRVVMLSPPNKGSELVDTFRKVPFLARNINGPAFFQLSTDEDSFVNQLGPISNECGIIAGTKTWNAFYSNIIPGSDDGKVSVDSAKLEGMKDFLEVEANHTFIMKNEDVIEQTLHFIEYGEFEHIET